MSKYTGMYIEGRTFTQIKSQDISLSDFSYIPYEHLDKNKLLYGRMPEKRNEVVLDKQLIDKVTEYTSAVSLMYDGYESYVGAKLHGSDATVKYKVVGISDMGEPSVYCSPNVILSLMENTTLVESDEEFNRENVKGYKKVKLKDNEVLIRKGFADSEGYKIGDQANLDGDYVIKGTFPDGLGVDYVMSDKGCKMLMCEQIYMDNACYSYTDNIPETKKYYKKISSKYLEKFEPVMTGAA